MDKDCEKIEALAPRKDNCELMAVLFLTAALALAIV
jgi:hypothetical protein